MAALSLISTATSSALLSVSFDAPAITTGISITLSDENIPPVAQPDGAVGSVSTPEIIDSDTIIPKAEEAAAGVVVVVDDDTDVADDNEDAGGEECAAGDEVAEENDEDAMRRFLAFANRGRASGSGLPALLAHLNNTVEAADDADTDVAELFVSGVAGVLREERETQAAVARFLEEDVQVADTPVNYDTVEEAQPTPEEYALRDRLLQLSAYRYAGKQRLDKTATQGLTLAKLKKEKKISRPLSRRLMKYMCEKDLYAECTRWGIPY
ncbi:hypothetical protein PYCCODRAFT_1461671, partial [Trametes coccinea BRFM310]